MGAGLDCAADCTVKAAEAAEGAAEAGEGVAESAEGASAETAEGVAGVEPLVFDLTPRPRFPLVPRLVGMVTTVCKTTPQGNKIALSCMKTTNIIDQDG